MADKHDDDKRTPKTQQTQPKKGEPVEIPVPKRGTWDKLLRRAAHADGEPRR